MNRILTCAGLAVVGAMAVHAQTIGEPSPSKLWSVSAKLRGFYDDNYTTGPSHEVPGRPKKDHSWGVSFSPSAALNLFREQTTLQLRYTYDLRWYEAREENETDHTHVADVALLHDFSERYRVELKDRFAYASEPEIIEPGAKATFYRGNNSAYRNYGSVAFYVDWSEKFGSRIGYENRFYDYEDEGPGSRSALLDRMEHLINLDLRYHWQPVTTVLVGYQFGYTDQLSHDLLANPAYMLPGIRIPEASYRDMRSHYGFVGVDHQFTPTLLGQARVGFQYADYFHADKNYWAPYADASLSYEYTTGSRAIVGIQHSIGATDLAMLRRRGGATVGSESTAIYAAISHRLLPRVRVFVRGSWQLSQYVGGPFDDKVDNYWTTDVNITYTVNEYVAVEAGYLYDRLDSDLNGRGYTRNRGYIGIKATY